MQPLSNRTNTFTDSVIRRMTRISAQGDRRHLRQHRGDDGRHDDRDQPRR